MVAVGALPTTTFAGTTDQVSGSVAPLEDPVTGEPPIAPPS